MGQLAVPQKRKLKELEAQLDEAYAVEDAGLQAYLIIGRVMAEIRDDKLYIGTYASFDDYCRDRWEEKRQTVDKRIAAMTAATDVMDVQIEVQNGDASVASLLTQTPKNANVANELSKAKGEETRADVWTKAVLTAPKNVPTASHVKRVIGEMFPATESEPVEDESVDPPQVAESAIELLAKLKPTDEQLTALAQYEEESQIELAESVASGIQSLDRAVETGEVPEETAQQVMERVNKEIESHCRAVKKLAGSCPEDPWMVKDGLRSNAIGHIDRYGKQLRLSKCTHVCPSCEGAGCEYCLETGRMPDYYFKQMSQKQQTGES